MLSYLVVFLIDLLGKSLEILLMLSYLAISLLDMLLLGIYLAF